MKKICLVLAVLGSVFAHADLIEEHDRLFRNEALCDSSLEEQVRAESHYKSMFATLKRDDELGRPSIVEVTSSVAYSTTLRNTLTGAECWIVLHGGCYSAFCD